MLQKVLGNEPVKAYCKHVPNAVNLYTQNCYSAPQKWMLPSYLYLTSIQGYCKMHFNKGEGGYQYMHSNTITCVAYVKFYISIISEIDSMY